MYLKLFKRKRDRGLCSCNNKSRTKTRTVYEYVDLYSGPEYEIFIKYSFILKYVYISFFYGLGMPILFPITFFALLNLYITDKLAVVYWHRMPPSYSNKIGDRALKCLQIATIPGLMVGYWMIGNTQIFSNKAGLRTFSNQQPDPEHHLILFWKNPLPSLFILVFLFVKLLRLKIQPFSKFVFQSINKCIDNIDQMQSIIPPYI